MKNSRFSQIVVSEQFDLLKKKSKNNFLLRRTIEFIVDFGRNRWVRRFDLING